MGTWSPISRPQECETAPIALDLEELRSESHNLILWVTAIVGWVSCFYAAVRLPQTSHPTLISVLLIVGAGVSGICRESSPWCTAVAVCSGARSSGLCYSLSVS